MLRNIFPLYFGPPKPEEINSKALANALAQHAALLNDRDLLQGQIAAFEAVIVRLSPTVYPDITVTS